MDKVPAVLDFIVIDYNPGQRQTTREREIIQARVRSHAAAVSHQRKRYTKPRGLTWDESSPAVKPPKQHRRPAVIYCSCYSTGFSPVLGPALSTITILRSSNYSNPTPEIYFPEKCRFCKRLIWSQKRSIASAVDKFAVRGGYRADPFDFVLPHAVTALQYFTEWAAPAHAPTWKIFNVCSMIPQVFLEVLQDDDCFFAISTSTKVRFHMPSSTAAIYDDSSSRNYGRALQNLQNRLARLDGKADGIMILSVIALLITALALGDTNAWKVHVYHMSTLLQAAGGLENLGYDGFVKGKVMQWDMQWCYQKGISHSIFPTIRRTHVSIPVDFPFSPEVEKLVARLPVGFQLLAEQGTLSMQTLEVLVRTIDSSDDPFYCTGRNLYHHDSRPYLDLWEACPCLIRPHDDSDGPDLEQMVAQALVLYCLQTFTTVQFTGALLAGTRSRLTASLRDLQKRTKYKTDLMVWIFMNAINLWSHGTDVGSLMSPRRELQKIMWTETYLIDDPDSVVSLLRKFLTNPEFENMCLDRL